MALGINTESPKDLPASLSTLRTETSKVSYPVLNNTETDYFFLLVNLIEKYLCTYFFPSVLNNTGTRQKENI